MAKKKPSIDIDGLSDTAFLDHLEEIVDGIPEKERRKYQDRINRLGEKTYFKASQLLSIKEKVAPPEKAGMHF